MWTPNIENSLREIRRRCVAYKYMHNNAAKIKKKAFYGISMNI